MKNFQATFKYKVITIKFYEFTYSDRGPTVSNQKRETISHYGMKSK